MMGDGLSLDAKRWIRSCMAERARSTRPAQPQTPIILHASRELRSHHQHLMVRRRAHLWHGNTKGKTRLATSTRNTGTRLWQPQVQEDSAVRPNYRADRTCGQLSFADLRKAHGDIGKVLTTTGMQRDLGMSKADAGRRTRRDEQEIQAWLTADQL